MIQIKRISSDIAEKLCRQITSELPEYFGLPEVNEHYALGVKARINLAAKIDDQYVALISLEFTYSTNANIYWMAVLPKYHIQGVGKKLIEAAYNLAIAKGAKTLTVETLSPKNADENYLKTYNFYLKNGFMPLFDLKPQGYEWNMVYMVRILAEINNVSENQHVAIRQLSSDDIPIIVDAFQNANWPKPASIFEDYLKEQENGERIIWLSFLEDKFAGYITLKFHSKYPSFLEKNIPEISDFNVLPKYRNKGIGHRLLKIAEDMAATRNNVIGIGVGLYSDYGAAQRMYIKQGYVPDGLGVTYNYKPVKPGGEVKLDDDLILWFLKELSKPLIILLTGASGSGKTTILKEVEKILPKNQVSINYFDDIGIPSFEDMIKEYGSCEKWQEAMTHKWLKKLELIKDKKYIFLEGSFNPEFAKNCSLLFCIHANRNIREQRLLNRKQPELITQDMENFAQTLKSKTLELGGIVIDSSSEKPEDIAKLIINKLEVVKL